MCCQECGAELGPRSRFCPVCGAAQFLITEPCLSLLMTAESGRASLLPAGFGALPPKKTTVAVLLAALLGPLGLLYCSVTGAFYMLAAWCFLVLATCSHWMASELCTMLVAWPICIAWSILAVRIYNEERR